MSTPRWNMTNHTPSPDQIKDIEELRERAIVLAEEIEHLCPPTRERSLAITNLEQALMWAVASIARNPQEDAK